MHQHFKILQQCSQRRLSPFRVENAFFLNYFCLYKLLADGFKWCAIKWKCAFWCNCFLILLPMTKKWNVFFIAWSVILLFYGKTIFAFDLRQFFVTFQLCCFAYLTSIDFFCWNKVINDWFLLIYYRQTTKEFTCLFWKVIRKKKIIIPNHCSINPSF